MLARKSSFTSQMRRLRHVYSMLENLNKEDIPPNLTLYNMMSDISGLVVELTKKVKGQDG